jgi:hypothetical protein
MESDSEVEISSNSEEEMTTTNRTRTPKLPPKLMDYDTSAKEQQGGEL